MACDSSAEPLRKFTELKQKQNSQSKEILDIDVDVQKIIRWQYDRTGTGLASH